MKIVIENYSKIIKNNKVLDNINYTFEGGKIYGLYGINASGKTMLMRAVAGLLFPTEGRVVVDGLQLRKDIDFPESIGLLLETPKFLPQYTGFENLKLLASIKRIINDDDIKESLRRVGLDENDRRKVRKYSLGMNQRLGIAAAIMERPDILILDEPFNGIDEDSLDMIRKLILSFKDNGSVVIMSCHDKTEIEHLSDEILHISSGRLI